MERVVVIVADSKTIQLHEGKLAILVVDEDKSALDKALEALGNPSLTQVKKKSVGHIVETSGNIVRVLKFTYPDPKTRKPYQFSAEQVKELIANKKIDEETRVILETLWRRIWEE